jgi:hypothetical protein
MAQELIENIVLPNGLILKIWDQSRSIAADTDKVTLYICAPIPLDPSFFPENTQFEKMRQCFGDTLLFEYKNERSFVAKAERDQVFRQFVDIFKKDTLPYLSKPDFARRYALSKYRDVEKNPYQYRDMP